MISPDKEIVTFLKEKKYIQLLSLCSVHKLLNRLISLSYDKRNLISWRAIEAIGLIMKEISKTRPELVRNTVTRLIWMIRDESGGICWSAPEIIGEIVRNNPSLCSDIASIISSFHEEIMLRTGVLYAISRIGNINDEFVQYTTPIILSHLHDPEPSIRGHAAIAAGEVGVKEALPELQKLENDNNIFLLYEGGELKEKPVSEVASRSITQLLKTCNDPSHEEK